MTLPEAEAALATHDAAQAARRDHDAAVRAHAAAKPTPPTGTRPEAPSAERPTADAVAEARRLLDTARTARALADRWTTDHGRLTRAVETAEARETATAAEAAWWQGYCAALRDLPAALLREALAALPACPHARVTVTDDGEIVVEGQSAAGAWVDLGALSAGETVRAVAELRGAIRDAARGRAKVWAWVPVTIDEAQSYDKRIEVPGLTWTMRTAPGELVVGVAS